MGVKKFIKKSVAFVAAAAMALTMVVAPVGAGASASYAAGTGSTTTDPNPNLILDKSAKLQDNGTYTITLEAYAKGRVETTPAVIKPCDIVLVLDQSGSMKWNFSGNNHNPSYSNSRQKALRDAATNFIENVSKNAQDKKVNHKMSIVTFEDDVYVKAKNVSLYDTNNSSQNANGKKTLTDAINNLGEKPEGATKINLGMQKADSLITEDSTRNKIVVVFTDGYPNQDNGFDIGTADTAISYAKSLKDKNAKVYTIGIFNGANVEQVSGTNSDAVDQRWETQVKQSTSNGKNAAANRFLNYMSSNFSDASSLGLKGENYSDWYQDYKYYKITKKFNRTASKYYMTASNQTELSNIFEKISDEVSEGKTDVVLDETAVAKDIMSENFNLPKNVTDNVKVFTEEYDGKDASDNLKWKNRQPLTDADVSYDTSEKSISVSGFSYKDNYIVDGKGNVATSGKKLIIEITGVTAKHAGMDMDTNNSNSAIYDGQGGKVKEFPMPKESIDSTSYVLDYGKTVTTDAADYGVSAVTIANTSAPSPEDAKLKGTYGTFALNNGDLDYTPGKINWDGIDTGYVFGEKSSSTSSNTEYKWEEVNFMPASSVYYEDDFGSFTTEKPNTDANVAIVWSEGWTSETDKVSSKDNSQSSTNSQYGWDDNYVDDTKSSNGSSHWSETSKATATFRFTGTAVDVYSRTNKDVGRILARIKRVNDDGTTTGIKTTTIDNISESSGEGSYYQIPTLFFDDLPYGTYEVTITVNPIRDNEGNVIRARYYLDGIRVYNPLNPIKLDPVAADAYEVAGESNANYITLRNDLITAADKKEISSKIDGAVFIDKSENKVGDETNNIGTYIDYGPKNEVYLGKNNGVAFKVDGYNSATDKVFVGLKSITGKETNVSITGETEPKSISSAADLYYEIKPDSNGNVVIQNNTENILSVTKVRITTKNQSTEGQPTENQSARKLVVTPQLMSYVSDFGKTQGDNKTETDLDKGDVDIDNPSDNDKEDNNQTEEKPTTSIWQEILNSLNKWFKR